MQRLQWVSRYQCSCPPTIKVPFILFFDFLKQNGFSINNEKLVDVPHPIDAYVDLGDGDNQFSNNKMKFFEELITRPLAKENL